MKITHLLVRWARRTLLHIGGCPPLEPRRMSEKGEVVLDGAQALDHHGLALYRSYDPCAVAVDHKSVLAARQHPSG